MEDVCDLEPGFALTAVTSSEPNDGPGDGNTSSDVQGVELGTGDVAFELRSERSGH